MQCMFYKCSYVVYCIIIDVFFIFLCCQKIDKTISVPSKLRGFFFNKYHQQNNYKNLNFGLLNLVKFPNCFPLFTPLFEYTLNHFQSAHFTYRNFVNFNKLSNLYFTQWAEPSGLFAIFTMAVYFFDINYFLALSIKLIWTIKSTFYKRTF